MAAASAAPAAGAGSSLCALACLGLDCFLCTGFCPACCIVVFFGFCIVSATSSYLSRTLRSTHSGAGSRQTAALGPDSVMVVIRQLPEENC